MRILWQGYVLDWLTGFYSAACYLRYGPNVFQSWNVPGIYTYVRCWGYY